MWKYLSSHRSEYALFLVRILNELNHSKIQSVLNKRRDTIAKKCKYFFLLIIIMFTRFQGESL